MYSNDYSSKSGFIKRILPIFGAGVISFAMLTGCGQKAPEVTAVTIDKDGKVSNVIIEEFGIQYDINELSEMAATEISEYNAEYPEPKITLDTVEKIDEGSFAKVAMSYEGAADYAYYNQCTLFYGTVQEAIDAGFKVSPELVNNAGEKVDLTAVMDHPDRHIIITTDKSNFKTPFNIEYRTQGVVLLGKKEAMLSSVTDNSVQLLLSK